MVFRQNYGVLLCNTALLNWFKHSKQGPEYFSRAEVKFGAEFGAKFSTEFGADFGAEFGAEPGPAESEKKNSEKKFFGAEGPKSFFETAEPEKRF